MGVVSRSFGQASSGDSAGSSGWIAKFLRFFCWRIICLGVHGDVAHEFLLERVTPAHGSHYVIASGRPYFQIWTHTVLGIGGFCVGSDRCGLHSGQNRDHLVALDSSGTEMRNCHFFLSDSRESHD